MIAEGRDEDLCLVFQAPECLGVDDPIAVPLEVGAQGGRFFQESLPTELFALEAWGESDSSLASNLKRTL